MTNNNQESISDWIPEDEPSKVQKAFKTINFIENKYKTYFKRGEKPPLLKIEKTTYEKALKEVDKYFKRQLKPLPDMSYVKKIINQRFWKIEYLRRKYFIDNKDNLNSIEEAFLLHELREKYDDLVKKKPPHLMLCGDFDNCYYKKHRSDLIYRDDFIKYPFFYNTKCQFGCNFKKIIKRDIITWHNYKHQNPMDSINTLHDNTNICWYHSSWSDEYKSQIDRLHSVSYKYGVLIFDLFALTSPEMLLNAGKENISNKKEKIRALFKEVRKYKTESKVNVPKNQDMHKLENEAKYIKDRIKSKDQLFTFELYLKKYITPEIFLMEEDGENTVYPEGMHYLILTPENQKIDKLNSEFGNYPVVIIFNIIGEDFTIKKALGHINSLIDYYKTYDVKEQIRSRPQNPEKHYDEMLVCFGFDPLIDTFNKKECLHQSELLLTSMEGLIDPKLYAPIENLKTMLPVFKEAECMKNYHEADLSRLIGLYLWDQIHIFDQTISKAISDFAESKLYESIKNFNPDEIEERKTNYDATGCLAEDSDRRYIRDCYNAAKKCVEAKKALGVL